MLLYHSDHQNPISDIDAIRPCTQTTTAWPLV